MSWFRRKKEPRRVPYALRNGAAWWAYEGERIINGSTEKNMQRTFEIYVDGAYIGSANPDVFKQVSKEINPLGLYVDVTHYPLGTDVIYHAGSRAPQIIRKVISAMDGIAQPTLKDAAQAFEKAINSEHGVEAKIVSIGAHDINAVITHTKWAVIVTRSERKQVYP